MQSTEPWRILPGKIEVSQIAVNFMVMPGGKPPLAASVVGRLELGSAVTLDVYAQVPDFLVRGGLADGSAVDLGPLIQYLGDTAAGVASTLAIDVLSFEAHPAGSYYWFSIDVEGDWQIVKQLEVEELAAALKYEGGAVDLTFKGRFVVGGVDLDIEAEYDSEAGGWQFSGAAAHDLPIMVGEFIKRLVADFSSSVADSLPDFRRSRSGLRADE